MPRGQYDRSKAKPRGSGRAPGKKNKDDPLDDIGHTFEAQLHKVKVLRDRKQSLDKQAEEAGEELRTACRELANVSDE